MLTNKRKFLSKAHTIPFMPLHNLTERLMKYFIQFLVMGLLSLSFPFLHGQGGKVEVVDGIKLNSIGYLPESPKIATIAGTSVANTAFSVINKVTNEVAMSGKMDAPFYHQSTDETLRNADFSSLQKRGEYFVRVDGLPDSATFRIETDIYNRSLFLNMIGFYGQRCGVPITFEHNGIVFEKKECHPNDGYLDFYNPEQAGQIKEGQGGWHDAGDYGKYTVNAAFSTGIMLLAWEQFGENLEKLVLPIPESGGAIPDYLAEIKFNLDWLLKMQFRDGRVSHKLTRQNFSGMVMPSEDDGKRYYVPWGTDATACFAAVTAQAARVYAPFDPEFADLCRTASMKAMVVARMRWHDVVPDQSAFRTGSYAAPALYDRTWALAEYWALTGDENLESSLARSFFDDNFVVDVDFDWGNGRNLGVITYLNSQRKKDAKVESAVQQDMILAADRILENMNKHGYGRGLRTYYWGCNGGIARLSLNLYTAYQLTGDKKYLDAIVTQLDYIYGRNPFGRSFVTGEGHNPPRYPHHRPSVADGIETPWPGHLVGGPHPTEIDWTDATYDASTNENAINWDASLLYALALFYTATQE